MEFEHNYRDFPELTNAQLEVLQFSSPHVQITEDFDAVVVKVHDGDTVTVSTSFRDFVFPVRLANIDAPELSEGGDVARDYLSGIILNQPVKILVNPMNRVGKYGRLIGEVIFGGLNIAEELMHLQLVKAFGLKKEGEISDVSKFFRMNQWF